MTKQEQKETLFKVFNILKDLEFPMTGAKAKVYSDALEAIGAVHNVMAKELKDGTDASKTQPKE